MFQDNVTLRVLVKGRAIQEYPHEGSTYVEGRQGSAYALQICNNNPHRIEAVISVDGLSVIDGKEAGLHSTGYVIEAFRTVTIPGWKLNGTEAAAFEFGAKDDAYATGVTGSSRNTGVIGVMAFREQSVARTPVLPGHYSVNGPFPSVLERHPVECGLQQRHFGPERLSGERQHDGVGDGHHPLDRSQRDGRARSRNRLCAGARHRIRGRH